MPADSRAQLMPPETLHATPTVDVILSYALIRVVRVVRTQATMQGQNGENSPNSAKYYGSRRRCRPDIQWSESPGGAAKPPHSSTRRMSSPLLLLLLLLLFLLAAGNLWAQVSAKYQHQLVHVYILIEQVDPNPQVKADLTEIFTVRPVQHL